MLEGWRSDAAVSRAHLLPLADGPDGDFAGRTGAACNYIGEDAIVFAFSRHFVFLRKMILDFTALPVREAYQWMTATIMPRPIAWVSTIAPEGKTNLAPTQATAGAPGLSENRQMF